MGFRIREAQVTRNRESRDRWAQYAQHRQRVTQLLLPATQARGQLLVLGAGNSNDLDLSALLPVFAEIHLVDMDSEALSSGVLRQNVPRHPAISLHAGIDLTGIADICAEWSETALPTSRQLDATIHLARHHSWSHIPTDCQVAASIGLLSQLTEMVLRSLGEQHSRAMELLAAVRARHMQLLLESVRPGGRAVLVTEIVSSASYPELPQTPESELSDVLRRLIANRNFFTGLNPAVLEALWHESPQVAPLVEHVQLSKPWLWDFGPRVYACCALSGIRRGG